LQVVNYQTAALMTGTTTIPLDDTIPQNTEGTEFMTLAITPKSATSNLRFSIVMYLTPNGGINNLIGALFQDSTVNALTTAQVYGATANGSTPLVLNYSMTSGTTSSTTFKVRGGMQSATTITLNGMGSARYYGGTWFSSITITEVVP